jgi:hypothetical protein
MSTARTNHNDAVSEPPADNASRIAIYDALYDLTAGSPDATATDEALFDAVIGRLRVLVPRELHLAGERAYFDEKLDACLHAGIVRRARAESPGELMLGAQAPSVRYPDGTVREYRPGLELARERLDGDNARLRAAGFDVRSAIPSIADDPEGPAFAAIVESMREHGFLKQFPLLRYEDDVVVDGRARLRAAALLEIEPEYVKYGSDRDRKAARRRDTPLHRVLVAIHSNAARLTTEEITAAHDEVAAVTRRPWEDTAADLAVTQEWRLGVPPEYSPHFEVKLLAFREGGEAKVQVTPDNKVMLRSLVESAGLSNYKINLLEGYVPFERARSSYSAGRKAVFAHASDLVTGIVAMQQDRRSDRRKLDPEWDEIRDWLVRTFATPVEEAGPEPASVAQV